MRYLGAPDPAPGTNSNEFLGGYGWAIPVAVLGTLLAVAAWGEARPNLRRRRRRRR